MSTLRLESPVKTRRARQGRKTLLVVEDEKLVRWSIREALRHDFRVRAVGSAEEAQKLLPRLKALDGLLVDIRLPGMNGLEFCKKVRASWPGVKVFVMTAYSRETAPRDAFGVHADGYLSKPFSLETLQDMMASHLGGKSA